MRLAMDPPADEAVKAAIESGELPSINDLLAHVTTVHQVVPEALPPAIRSYLEDTDGLPDWADEAVIDEGVRMFGTHGPALLTALFCASLPATYAARKGVRVVYLTGRLRGDLKRRLFETAQFLLELFSPGGLDPDRSGAAIRTCQRVRLMHAGVRYRVRQSGDWDTAELGEPINQEDMAGLLMAVTAHALRALKRLGVEVSADEQEAYLHVWNIAGALLGVRPELLAADVAEAEALTDLIWRRQIAASAEGEAMADALVQGLEYALPGTIFDGLPRTLIRHLDERVADVLGLPPDDWTVKLFGLLEAAFDVSAETADLNTSMASAVGVFNRELMRAVVYTDRGPHRPAFSIPEALVPRLQEAPPHLVRRPTIWG
jgi:hypothetical protein